ncbi:MAG: BON domain-containing protein [Nocardiaceae bacterium]|nr:BON domain-containing protein [Nocardiaceae bacterium]
MIPKIDRCLHSLTKAANALSSAAIPFAVGGSPAVYARGGPATAQAVDLFIKREDADRSFNEVVRTGMYVSPQPEGRDTTLSDNGILVNLIPRADGDAIFTRASWMRVGPTSAYVLSGTDLIIESLKVLNPRKLDFSELLQVARSLREQVDWSAVRALTHQSPYARAFLGLLEDFRITTPTTDPVHEHDHELSAYVEARLREAFAHDPRAGELGISVSVAGNHVTLTGLISSTLRRQALETIVREHLPDAEIDDQVELVETPEPHDLEEMS